MGDLRIVCVSSRIRSGGEVWTGGLGCILFHCCALKARMMMIWRVADSDVDLGLMEAGKAWITGNSRLCFLWLSYQDMERSI